MIFTGLKRKSNQIFFNKKIISSDFSYKENGLFKIKKVLVYLDDIDNKSAILEKLAAKLNILENDIDILVFQNKISKEIVDENVISAKDFGWFGKIKSMRLKSILTNKYDLLINYSKKDEFYSNLLLLQCKITLRVGFAHLDNRYYDLLIACDPDFFSLFNLELIKYLKILKKI